MIFFEISFMPNTLLFRGYTVKEGHIEHLKEMLDYCFDMEWETQEEKAEALKSALNMVLECVRYANLIITFDITTEIHLSQKILEALLTSQELSLDHQLQLAIVWDRPDIAEGHIFSDGVNVISTGTILPLVFSAWNRTAPNF